MKNEDKVRKKYPLMIAVTIGAGIVYFFYGQFLYQSLYEKIWSPFLMGLYFGGLGLSVTLTIYFFSRVKGVKPKDNSVFLYTLIALVFLVIISVFFEFLYEIGIKNIYTEPSSYVIVLDNSDSMRGSDPEQKRVGAIPVILQEKETSFPYAVYTFSDSVSLIRNMEPVSAGNSISVLETENGTAVVGALQKISSDLSSGVIVGGSSPKILLLSDGYATDYSIFNRATLNKILGDFSKSGVTISTVGLGNADRSFLENISRRTGGVYIEVQELSSLGNAMKEAIEHASERDLISVRFVKSFNLLYALIRIIFIFLIGMIIGYIKMIVCCTPEDEKRIIYVSLFGCMCAAVMMEIGLNVFYFPEPLMRLFMCVMIAITPATVKVQRRLDLKLDELDEIKIGKSETNNVNSLSDNKKNNKVKNVDRLQ